MLTNRRNILLLFVALFFAFIVTASTQAQDKGKEKGKSKVITAKADKTRGADLDAAIKGVSKTNDPKAKPAIPPNKGGSKSRGAGGYTKIENWTGWYIDVYAKIGGTWYYEGTATPYGNMWVYTGSECGDFYGYSSFLDGSSLHWGTSYVCSDTWKLTE